MRVLAVCAAAITLPACIYYDPGPQPEQADAIIFYPPDASIDGPPAPPFDVTDCTTDPICPEPPSNRVTVCGRIYDVETGGPIAPGIVGEVCRDGVTAGACALNIEPYDALAYAQDTSIDPQDYASKYLDSCGRFQLVDVVRPMLTYLGLGIDDSSAADDYGIGGSAFAVNFGESRANIKAYAIRHSTDATWTAAASLTGGSFLERGVILMEFHDGTTPAEGVVVTEGPSPEPDNDYYFSDTTTDTHRTIAPLQLATGANGSALKINSSLVEHSGTGGGCSNWSSGLATGIAGVMLYAPRECQ